MPDSNVGENDAVQAFSSNSSDIGFLADLGRVIAKRKNFKHDREGRKVIGMFMAALRILD